MQNNRYNILFESVPIGPVVAKNRFFQVPHCCGMGYRYPNASAAMRGIKAEGGWAVVCTEETEIHPTGDIAPYLENRIWDEHDVQALSVMTEAIHAHGSLAGIELCHNGLHAANLYSRETPLAPSATIVDTGHPIHAKAMTRRDISRLRTWHTNAAKRAMRAGFDIVYVYAAHDMSLLQHFISRRHNQRSDEYGGSLENRVRLLREILQDTKDAVGDRCAVALRFAVEEFLGNDGIEASGEGHDVVSMLADIPDLFDVNVSDWSRDSASSRFQPEGYQEDYIRFVKQLTNKPVVGVGRYTSPDSMLRVVQQEIMDFIGAARPSIADPFLPNKIKDGALEDIRECIGCNICVTGDSTCTPIRCTQNPTMGEEWRKGWHPERIPAAKEDARVLVVGGGPAGLEATRALAARGLDVTLTERTRVWGGRVERESRLPGLSEWRRVRDWRIGQLEKMDNAHLYLESHMSAADVVEVGATHIVLATGSHWRRDGIGRSNFAPIEGLERMRVFTPDDLLTQGVDRLATVLTGPVVVYDTEAHYLGGVVAEAIRTAGIDVTLVTPDPVVSSWTEHSLEQKHIQRRLIELGVSIMTSAQLIACEDEAVRTACVYSGRTTHRAAASLVLVTSRLPNDALFDELVAQEAALRAGGNQGVIQIGDCLAPATIANAIYSGHRYAREFGTRIDPDLPAFKREAIVVSKG